MRCTLTVEVKALPIILAVEEDQQEALLITLGDPSPHYNA